MDTSYPPPSLANGSLYYAHLVAVVGGLMDYGLVMRSSLFLDMTFCSLGLEQKV